MDSRYKDHVMIINYLIIVYSKLMGRIDMKVVLFGAYDGKAPRYRILKKGLKRNGVDVVECNDRSKPILLRLLRLVKKHRYLEYDILLIGHVGQYVVPLAKLISRKIVVFDIFNSLYETIVVDRKLVQEGSFKAKMLFTLDKYSFKLSHLCIADTYQHKLYFSRAFNIEKSKFEVVYPGSDDDIFYPRRKSGDETFLILFVGSFLPLHGVSFIIRAAKMLERYKDVRFHLVGHGQTYVEATELARQLNVKNISFLPPVRYEDLPKYIAQADVCLGIFGNTDKAKRVVPFKVFDALAMRKPVITGDSPAVREILKNKENCLLCRMGDPKQLADSIILLYEDRKLGEKIAKNGYKLFKKHFTIKSIGKKLKTILNTLL